MFTDVPYDHITNELIERLHGDFAGCTNLRLVGDKTVGGKRVSFVRIK